MTTHARVVRGWLPDHEELKAPADTGLVNGRPARQFELDILERARAAALAAETAALFAGVRRTT